MEMDPSENEFCNFPMFRTTNRYEKANTDQCDNLGLYDPSLCVAI